MPYLIRHTLTPVLLGFDRNLPQSAAEPLRHVAGRYGTGLLIRQPDPTNPAFDRQTYRELLSSWTRPMLDRYGHADILLAGRSATIRIGTAGTSRSRMLAQRLTKLLPDTATQAAFATTADPPMHDARIGLAEILLPDHILPTLPDMIDTLLTDLTALPSRHHA